MKLHIRVKNIDLIKLKIAEDPTNMEIFMIFQNNQELLEEGERKNFKETVGLNEEYKFIFDTLKKYTTLSKQEISHELSTDVFILFEGGESTHTATVIIPVEYIDIN